MLSERRSFPLPCAETEARMNVLWTGQRTDMRGAESPGGAPDTGLGGSPMSDLSRHSHDLCQNRVPTEACMTDRGRILLVDDSDPVRETLADLLDVEGF